MNILVVGLGNPGDKYAHHRHSVGHMFVDWIGKQHENILWRADSNKRAAHAHIQGPGDTSIIIAETRTYMNESGKAAHILCKELEVSDTKALVIVHDDLDFPVGQWKLGFAKGPKLHNGITSVEASLHTDRFWRLRIGIENRPPTMRVPGETYVLQNFTSDEKNMVYAEFPRMWQQILTLAP